MSRIDEALRLTTRTPSGSEPNVLQDEFVSPWSFREQRPPVPESLVGQIPEPVSQLDARPITRRANAHFTDAVAERLVTAPLADVLLVEQFRQLAATIHQAQTNSNVRIVMVTSAEAAEGKSMTALNLALTLSESYRRRVLLIDADLRRPSLHALAGLPNESGLGETLRQPTREKVPAYQWSPMLTIVPAGQPDVNPMSALTSPRMRQILDDAAAHFDCVVLDTPPIAPIVDSSLLAPMADAVLLVVRAGHASYGTLRKTIEAIGRERILGVVLNDAVPEGDGYRSSYYAYRPAEPTR